MKLYSSSNAYSRVDGVMSSPESRAGWRLLNGNVARPENLRKFVLILRNEEYTTPGGRPRTPCEHDGLPAVALDRARLLHQLRPALVEQLPHRLLGDREALARA